MESDNESHDNSVSHELIQENLDYLRDKAVIMGQRAVHHDNVSKRLSKLRLVSHFSLVIVEVISQSSLLSVAVSLRGGSSSEKVGLFTLIITAITTINIILNKLIALMTFDKKIAHHLEKRRNHLQIKSQIDELVLSFTRKKPSSDKLKKINMKINYFNKQILELD